MKKAQTKDRFLWGHDEREWFVAAVPGKATTVAQARNALKPEGIVIRPVDEAASPVLPRGRLSAKVISERYALKYGE